MPVPISTGPKKNALASAMPMLTVGAALLLAALGYFLLLKPKISPLVTGGSLDLGAAETQVKDDEAYLKRLQSAKEDFSKLNAERRAKIAGIVPSSADVPGIFVQTDAIAAKNGFVLLSIDAVPDEKTVDLTGRRNVRVTANVAGGTYPQFKAFLGDLELALRVSDVQSAVFSSGGGTYSLVFKTYYVDPSGKPAVAAVK